MKLTDNFSYEELTNTSFKDYLQDVRNASKGYYPALYLLAKEVLEPIRKILGDQPLHVTSGMRSRSLNAKLGGVSNSQHLYGQAVDLVPKVGTPEEAFNKLISSPEFQKIPIGQIILEKSVKIVDGKKVVIATWIHVSLGSPYTEYDHEVLKLDK